jgi:uncharacterized protein
MVKQTYLTVTEAMGDEPTICISTSAEDRDGDVLEPAGCDLTNYRRNPVVLFGHDYSSLPVGSCTSVDVRPEGIVASWRWLENDPMADRVRNAFDQGVLRAASVGFRPGVSQRRANGGLLYKTWSLLEWSLVPIPSNPGAVRLAKSLIGVSSDDAILRISDDDDESLDFDRSDLAAAFREAFPGVLRDAIGDAVQSEVARAVARVRGRIVDDPTADRFARYRSVAGAGERVVVDPDEVRRELRAQVPRIAQSFIDELGPVIRSEAARAFDRLRGRID